MYIIYNTVSISDSSCLRDKLGRDRVQKVGDATKTFVNWQVPPDRPLIHEWYQSG